MIPLPGKIEEAAALLNAGELVAFPTETVYGLGADATNPRAVMRIFEAKGRPASHPLIVHFSNFASARAWASEVPPAAERLAEAFWPGPLTLVLPRSRVVPDVVTGGQDTVGLRAPAHPVARALLAAFGRGIAAPSANRYGRISPTRAADVRAELGRRVALVLDGGDCEVGLESTIVACLGGRVTLLRPGSISRSQVADIVGRVDDPGADAPRAPGGQRSHYAPGTPLELVAPDRLARAVEAAAAKGRVAVLARSAPTAESDRVAWKRMPAGPGPYGRALYAALRALDDSGAALIIVEAVPAGEAWAAVSDRLARAAARGDDANGGVTDAP